MMKIAIVGCTGLVGSEILKVLSELKLPITKLIPVASSKSIGKEVIFNNSTLEVIADSYTHLRLPTICSV